MDTFICTLNWPLKELSANTQKMFGGCDHEGALTHILGTTLHRHHSLPLCSVLFHAYFVVLSLFHELVRCLISFSTLSNITCPVDDCADVHTLS